MDLLQCREEIDQIDEQIIALFEKRMDVIQQVALLKKGKDTLIFDQSREEKMIKNNSEKIKNKKYQKYYGPVLQSFLKVSKQMQADIIKGVQ